MACFLVPVTEAVITTAAGKAVRAAEKKNGGCAEGHIAFSEKLGWLNKMLWGGSALLAFEHVWHGEVVPFFPFLTAASDPASLSEMLSEMATRGVGMSVLVTAVWLCMVAVSSAAEKRAAADTPARENGGAEK